MSLHLYIPAAATHSGLVFITESLASIFGKMGCLLGYTEEKKVDPSTQTSHLLQMPESIQKKERKEKKTNKELIYTVRNR